MERPRTSAALIGALLLLQAQWAAAQNQPGPKRGPVQLTEAGLKLHRDALVFDGHNDLPYQFARQGDIFFQRLDITRPQPSLHTDIPRLRKGGVGAQFWAAYVD